jgi:hypothetical protein
MMNRIVTRTRSTPGGGSWRLASRTRSTYLSAMQERSAGRCIVGGHRCAKLSSIAIMVMVLAAACTSAAPPHQARSHAESSTPGRAATPAKVSTVLKREGLVLPATYRQACAAEAQAFGCLHVPAGPIPAALRRPLHFPVLRAGQHCPATRGTRFNSGWFGGMALGTGPVRVLAGSNRRGIAELINPTSSPPWLGLKTLWFSLPGYQGPFVIRAKRLDRPGLVALGEGPVLTPLVVPSGPTLNSGLAYRTVPGGLWVRSPGCYAWQVDGLTFSEIIIVQAVPR